MKRLVVLAGLVLMGVTMCFAQRGTVAGDWRVIWTSPDGSVFSGEMRLEQGRGCKTCALAGEGSVRGRIVWTLRKAGPKSGGEVGATSTELVMGEMKGEGLLVLNGYERDDPGKIKSLDHYRLAIADTGNVMGGITLNGGPWTGQFIAMRTHEYLPPE